MKRFFSGMNSKVCVQLSLSAEFLTTNYAFKRFLSCMDDVVLGETSCHSELLTTFSRPPGEFKKSFLKRLIFTEKRLKKVFQSQDLAIKICREMQRYSLWSGLVIWRQVFSQRFVFLGFFFFLENFYVGQDGAKWCDAPRRTVCGGFGRSSVGEIFLQIWALRRAF